MPFIYVITISIINKLYTHIINILNPFKLYKKNTNSVLLIHTYSLRQLNIVDVYRNLSVFISFPTLNCVIYIVIMRILAMWYVYSICLSSLEFFIELYYAQFWVKWMWSKLRQEITDSVLQFSTSLIFIL